MAPPSSALDLRLGSRDPSFRPPVRRPLPEVAVPPWTPLFVRDVQVLGIDPRDVELLLVRVTLGAMASVAWQGAFLSTYFRYVLRPEQPTFDGEGLVLSVPDAHLEQALAAVDQAVVAANRTHPGLEAAEPIQASKKPSRHTIDLNEAVSSDLRQRLLAARRRTQAMSGLFDSALWTAEPDSTQRPPVSLPQTSQPPSVLLPPSVPLSRSAPPRRADDLRKTVAFRRPRVSSMG